ncbi:MAG: TIGR02996 domain-containing protein [Planctomycetia bacterium]|nr:TIGR02996 domain-containing protein [Planctomycetia bacterium]
MNHETGLVESVLESPDDDAPRLVYADWLEERGDPRAEFIRVQCAAARLPADDLRLPGLQARAKQLLAHARDWSAPLGLEPEACEFRRGFVEAVEVATDRFLERPDALFHSAPIRQIHFLHATRHLRELADCPWLAKLATLDLSANALRDAGAAILAASPHLTRLAALDLGGCEIHQAGAESLAGATDLHKLVELRMAGCGIGPSGLQAILASPALARVEALDVRGNHQCWVNPNRGEPWVTLTETNIQNDGVRLLAESNTSSRLAFVDLSLNSIEASGWEAILHSPHLAGMTCLNAFESDHVYADEGPSEPALGSERRTINEEISDVLCVSIPGGSRRSIRRTTGDPRWTAPPCTIDPGWVERLRRRFGHRITFRPPAVRFGAHFGGTRDDWFGGRAVLERVDDLIR